jgi:hypothetical protein
LGEAKIGKSSLLHCLARDWAGEVIGPIDLQGLTGREDFYAALAEGLGLDYQTDSDWRALRQALRERQALVMLDELDVGPSLGIDAGDLARFRAVCAENRGLKVIAVARRPLREVFDTVVGSDGYNFLVPYTLEGMPEAEARQLLDHPWDTRAVRFDATMAQTLLSLAGGHPFKVQRAAFHRFEALTDPGYDWQAAWRQDMDHLL